MSLTEVLQQLPAFSVAERQKLVRRALELDDAGLDDEELQLVESRLEAHCQAPESAVSLEDMKARLRARFSI